MTSLSLSGPLTVLAERLTVAVAPPSLGHLIALMDQGEMVQEFLRLIREFLPEHEGEIMGSRSRVETFVRCFEERYFPLHDSIMQDDEEDGLEFLTGYIPVVVDGLSYDDYHEFQSWSPGFLLLLALVAYPWEDYEEGGARVALLEECVKLVGEELVGRIAPLGWKPEEIHQRLDGTTLEGAALFADYVWHQTGTIFLDETYETAWDCGLEWSRENVEGLAAEWPRARRHHEQVNSIIDWLQAAPRANFTRLLDALGARPEPIPKEQLPLPLGGGDEEEEVP